MGSGPLPENVSMCHTIMKGLRLILLLKDAKIKKLEIANNGPVVEPDYKQLGSLPIWAQQHYNILEGEKALLTKNHS